MKICPTCKKTYHDEELNFCLADGATLLKKRNGAVKHSRTNEVLAVILLALAVLVFLCLISFNQSDPTFNTASSQKVQNWLGVVGANLAGHLLSMFGSTAYLFPALLALIAWRIFQSESLRPRLSRTIGFILFVVSASGLISLAGWQGGIFGAFFAYYASYLLFTIGAAILLTILFIFALLLITDLSFLGVFGNFELAWENFKVHFTEWNTSRRERRAEEMKERLEKRRELREKKNVEATPTISIGDTRAAVSKAAFPDLKTKSDFAKEPSVSTIGAAMERVPETIISESPDLDEAAAIDKTTGKISIATVKQMSYLEDFPVTEPADDKVDENFGPQTIRRNSYENYVLPSSALLTPSAPPIELNERELLANAETITDRIKEFNVPGKVMNICPGPVVTTYEFKPDPGVKPASVTALSEEISLALKTESVRIGRIPGKAFLGIEVPNYIRETIQLRDVIESKKFKESKSLLTIALGKTIDAHNYVVDLAEMPHLLIAGVTGAGKSITVHSLIVSILYKARPDEVKFIMVDPKRLELGFYADIPHLATPIITDSERAAISLHWAVSEMERRYKDLAGYGVRNIDGYNVETKRRNALEQWDEFGQPHRNLPYIVIIIEELADLIKEGDDSAEGLVKTLAQSGRAVGIHLVLATQRPSVDVIAGLIKANFPARISFRVSSKVDSRTIIDGNGAEALLGKGDMLFLPPATSQLIRVHGAFVDEKEIAAIVGHVKSQGRPEYDTTITKSEKELDDSGDLPGRRDPLFMDALRTVVNAKRGSTSLLQRHLRIGYGRAAAILDAMVKEGYIGDMDGSSRVRPVLQKAYDDLQDINEMESI